MRIGKHVPNRSPLQAAGPHQRGFTLLVLMVLLALLALVTYRLGDALATHVQREREQQLLRLGALYAQALQNYYRASPGNHKTYPMALDALLRDMRFVGVVRHMRELYPDPLDTASPWGLVRDSTGAIVGVYSQSAQRPLLQTSAAPVAKALHYSDWKFIAKDVP